MRIDMTELAKVRVLAGSLAGGIVFRKLLEAAKSEPSTAEPLFLDFAEVDVATASFLRESVLAFRDHMRRRRSNFYPIVANANDAVREELLLVASSGGGALMACKLGRGDKATAPHLIGELEPKQRRAFDLVTKIGMTDAGQLRREYADDAQHTTAWNNRLSALANLGLVIEFSEGRAKKYRTLLEGV